ncbi:Histidine phosphatase superfamily clade-2 [Penicillium hispanicum]|uniref:Histidine phosphatase superfamily clade-2 n=1 Tax=Penicillium hispanicum TaxID=1080232 RepID=UPI00253FE6B9|nr:Histidine phosphatase superfamily clade-2 [Penicillium hispanicum]KAJ5579846.1 Histidine phosphatase superfamily clade-2 [Penicillium hispanicum]
MPGHRNEHPNLDEEERLLGEDCPVEAPRSSKTSQASSRWTVAGIAALLGILAFAGVSMVTRYEPSHFVPVLPSSAPDHQGAVSSRPRNTVHRPRACNSVAGGYNCFADISHHWGQYSPYFSLAPESISDAVPDNCQVTFVQVISRHGARYPTASKSEQYRELVAAIQANATHLEGRYAFLRDYKYTLGSEDLTTFGEYQMIHSGIKFYKRYESLARDHVPFIRASDSSRVVRSGRKFIQGFEQTKRQSQSLQRDQDSPKINVVLSEDPGSNNTLNHNTCPVFEASGLGDDVAADYADLFALPIQKRLEKHLPGVQLSTEDVVHLMDVCAFDTVASTSDGSKQSGFCQLFTLPEWAQYNYLQSLGKYYGYGAGNPLGPTQGIGFVNELIARLTHTPVHDDTTTNHTLDAPGAPTFPVDRTLYADFTHDNGMIPIFFALGLYNGTSELPRTHVQSKSAADGYSAAWTVPFGARAYIEMMQCPSDPNPEPFVRVLVNDRVVPLHGCAVDALGRCRREDFINGLSFARSDGNWANCYS